jgi:hypothetical protein
MIYLRIVTFIVFSMFSLLGLTMITDEVPLFPQSHNVHGYDGHWAANRLRKKVEPNSTIFAACEMSTDGFEFKIISSEFLSQLDNAYHTTYVSSAGTFLTDVSLFGEDFEYKYQLSGELTEESGVGYEVWINNTTAETLCSSEIQYRKRELRKYKNSYFGLILGVSKIEDVEKVVGKSLELVGKNKYFFSKYVLVTFSENDLLNTIIITDESYRDLNGIIVGAVKSKVLELDGVKGNCFDRSCLDENNGIAYWFDESNIVTKIVLINEAVLK